MRYSLIAAALLLLSGCSKPAPTTSLHDEDRFFEGGPSFPNLALGPSAEHGRLSELFTARAPLPSVATGYRFNEESSLYQVQYDDQSYWDIWGGGFYYTSGSVRSALFVR